MDYAQDLLNYLSQAPENIADAFRIAAEFTTHAWHKVTESFGGYGVAVLFSAVLVIDTLRKMHLRGQALDSIRGISSSIHTEGLSKAQEKLLSLVDSLRSKSRDVALIGPDKNGDLYSAVRLGFGWAVLLAGNDGKNYLIRSETLDKLKQKLGLQTDDADEHRRIDVLGSMGNEMFDRGIERLENLGNKYRNDIHVLYGNPIVEKLGNGDLLSRTPFFGAYATRQEDGSYAVDLYVNPEGKRELIEIPDSSRKLRAQAIPAKDEEEARRIAFRYNQIWHHMTIQHANLDKMRAANEEKIAQLGTTHVKDGVLDTSSAEVKAALAERERLNTIEAEFSGRGRGLFGLVAEGLKEGLEDGAREALESKNIMTFLAISAKHLAAADKITELATGLLIPGQEAAAKWWGGPRMIEEYAAAPEGMMAKISQPRLEMGAITLTASRDGETIADMVRDGSLKPMDLSRVLNKATVINLAGRDIPEGFRIGEYMRNWAAKPNTYGIEPASTYFISQRNCGLEMLAYNHPVEGDSPHVNGKFVYMPGAPFAAGANNPNNNWEQFTAEQRALIGGSFEQLAKQDYPEYIKKHTEKGHVLYQHPTNGKIYIFEKKTVLGFLERPAEQVGIAVPVEKALEVIEGAKVQNLHDARSGRHIRDVESGFQRDVSSAERKDKKLHIPKEVKKVADGSYIGVLAWDKKRREYVALYIERDRVGQDDVTKTKYGLFGGLLKWLPELRDSRLVAARELKEEWRDKNGKPVLENIGPERFEKVDTSYVYNKAGVEGHDANFDQDRFPTLASGHILVLTESESEIALKQIEQDNLEGRAQRRADRLQDRTGGETVNVFAIPLSELTRRLAATRKSYAQKKSGQPDAPVGETQLLECHYRHEFEFLERAVAPRMEQQNKLGGPRRRFWHRNTPTAQAKAAA